MSVRERLLGIPELNVVQKLIGMSDNQLRDYIQSLSSFVEVFPEQETALRAALEEKDYLAFSKHLVTLKDMLLQIYADGMAEECQKQINGLINLNHERIEAYMTYCLSTAAMLSIDIQMAIYNEDNAEDARSDEIIAEPDNGRCGILAVDDNPYFLDILKSTLQDTDYKLTCLTSGEAVLKYLNNRDPDLFILDIDMPDMDGYELAQKIKELGKNAPIIFLTGNAKREYVVKAVEVGAVDFIIKPINKKQVLERINRACQ